MATIFQFIFLSTVAFGRLTNPDVEASASPPVVASFPSSQEVLSTGGSGGTISFNKWKYYEKMNELKKEADGNKIQTDEFGRKIWINSSCNQQALKDEVYMYVQGACQFESLKHSCSASKQQAMIVNQAVQSNLAVAQSQGESSLRQTWNSMKQMFNEIVQANEVCANEVRSATVDNPICLNAINEFFFMRAYNDYLSQCNGADFESILISIGGGLEDAGQDLQSKVIEPHKKARQYEYDIAKSMIEYEKVIASLKSQSANLREPANKEGQ